MQILNLYKTGSKRTLNLKLNILGKHYATNLLKITVNAYTGKVIVHCPPPLKHQKTFHAMLGFELLKFTIIDFNLHFIYEKYYD